MSTKRAIFVCQLSGASERAAGFSTPCALLASPLSRHFPPVPPGFIRWSTCPRCAILGIARARTAPARTVPARTVPDSHTSPSRSCLSRTAAARGAPSGERGLVILALRKLHRQPTGVPLYAVTALLGSCALSAILILGLKTYRVWARACEWA